ncbi:MAG: 1-deoxy-D-xylulose-5-phosphate reductoisomerase [Nitrospirae bacterium CG_4_10_14_3_um_filter_44_29]|nr:1-deoxy-D-xylulose-5-phosphate reductoisomerase [Nitrospirota bacterium]OIO32165.1 MAG: 1-deoxy-D-xylulose-5-phosphate reductoisomerase [Nitrospirae bacterium CG1_02_44_142]PIP70901.1 MAG: 1-deoxy-D-xylulose-5-phosphate reductoisomerase [Nitrospirae bacterium CG22_combo_CG10-13_8_21_14_all_44_11]PIV40602.1 MAG: 1-deoxy-D-xylulose-5-phosphate reductoisomerase [Nitrospirae bacterium CG02_land_8_20_14_3_00_44_33]PIV66612.1 MAG: 1-deoxy-D-xylulose-5-phosphate reductoisomerase [Nitrospirae bacter
MKHVTILGSTGSIGRSALEVLSRCRDRFKIVGLTAKNNIELLEKQIRAFNPEIAAVADEAAASELSKKLGIRVLSGDSGIAEAASYDKADFVLSAIIGFAGLLPTLSAVRAGKTIGLANKESLAAAGEIVMRDAVKSGAKIIPVDSEHSAIFQCIEGRSRESVKRIVITASGGPFLGKSRSELNKVTIKDALKHPNWDMGKKITIDSATLMNKGLEVIEAHRLFGFSPDMIDVLIHPQSIIHSMIELKDRSCIAQLSVPDMKGPIAYALSYPERLDDPMPFLDLSAVGKLTFQKPDTEGFPCLLYAYEAMKEGGTMPAVLNAANEVAVNAFLQSEIGFNEIPVVINNTMQLHDRKSALEVDAVVEADRWAREKAKAMIAKLN